MPGNPARLPQTRHQRLARSSGRTLRSIGDDLGVGLSTLSRWIGWARDRKGPAKDGAAQADLVAELIRLRWEDEVLREERGILKRATAFFVREGTR